MKAYQLLNLCKPFIEQLISFDLSVNDLKHIDMFNDYLRLLSDGEKQTYIVAHLSEQYNISERQVFRVIKKLEQNLYY